MNSFFTHIAHQESQPFKGKNRRTSNRYALRMPLQYRTSGSTLDSAWKTGRTLDISASGVQIEIPEAMPVGSRLELVMDWPGLYHCRPVVRLFLTASVMRTVADTNGTCIALRILNHLFGDVRPAAVRPPGAARTQAVA
jgi:PilZ domain